MTTKYRDHKQFKRKKLDEKSTSCISPLKNKSSQQLNTGSPYDLQLILLSISSNGSENLCVYTKTYPWTFIAALLIITKNRKQQRFL